MSNHRIGAAVRSQFSSSTNPYNTFYADFDTYVPSIQSGFGLYVMNDRSYVWQSTSAGLSYAYAFNISEDVMVRPALQVVYHRQQQSSRGYTFPDGVNGSGGSTTIIYPLQNEILQDFDFTTGLLFSHPSWEAGLAVGHIGAKKNDSLMVYANRPVKLTIHGRGAFAIIGDANLQNPDLTEWNTFSEAKIIPYSIIAYQGDYRNIVLGSDIQVGALYAGLNVRSDFDFKAACIGLALGLSSSSLKIGYNVDIMGFGSQLRGWNSTSHELYVHFNFGETSERAVKSGKKERKKSDCVGCPY